MTDKMPSNTVHPHTDKHQCRGGESGDKLTSDGSGTQKKLLFSAENMRGRLTSWHVHTVG